MKNNENPFEDLISLSKRISVLNEKCKNIDINTEKVERSKQSLSGQFMKLENESVDIPQNFELLIVKLMEFVEKRKELSANWKKLTQQRSAINSNGEFIEDLIIKNEKSHLSNNRIAQIEMLLIQFEQVVTKQEQVIKQRENILKEEELVITEIEMNLVKLKKN